MGALGETHQRSAEGKVAPDMKPSGLLVLVRLGILVAATALLASPKGRAADGTELFAIGAIQKGMGGAGVAAPKDATWTLLNPASLVDLPRRIDLGLEVLFLRETVTPRGNPIAANPFAGTLSDRSVLAVPSFGVVWPLGKGALGFGVFGHHGNKVDYGRPRTTLGIFGNFDRRLDYQLVKFPVAYAYRFSSGWALGIAAVPAFARLRTDSFTLSLGPTRGGHKWEDALGIGLKLGVYRRWEKWGVGATYTSRTWMEHYDRYDDLLVDGKLDLPQKFRIGFAYRPIRKLEFVLDYKWIRLSEIDTLANKTIWGGLGWKDRHIVKGGVTWDVNRRWTLRSGFSWTPSPIEREFSFVNAMTASLTELHLAAGFSYHLGERSAFHFSYAHAFPEEQTDSGRGDIFSFLGRGTKIGYAEDSLTFQYSYLF